MKEELKEETELEITEEQFQGIPMRIVLNGNEKFVPLADIARAIGCDKTNLHHIIKRNFELFKGETLNHILDTPGGMQEMARLTPDGVIGLLMNFFPRSERLCTGEEEKCKGQCVTALQSRTIP